MEGVTIEKLRADDKEAFFSYIQRSYKPQHIMCDEKYLSWQFDLVLIVKVRGEIVGHIGFKDIDFWCQDNTVPVREYMNLEVDRRYHKTGVGALLLQHATADAKAGLIMGFKEHLLPLLNRIHSGWSQEENFKRYVHILNPKAELFDDFSILPLEQEEKTHNCHFSASRFDSEFDDLWEQCKHTFDFTVDRSSDYLNWRFFDHPHFSYQTLIHREHEKISGYLVFRTEETEKFTIHRIVDLIGTKASIRELLKAIGIEARKQRSDMIDFMFLGPHYNAELLDTGFFNVAGTDFERFPIRFSPISYDKLIINTSHNIPFEPKNELLTKADIDMDRFNPH